MQTGLIQFCGCPLIAAPYGPNDHAQPSASRQPLTTAVACNAPIRYM